ncbi:hypothetical protein AS850_05505 [Frondihabitans sp. 762G35]|uniref:hypothetical protein n=1 Tax=Frondihabitans sp. 762G35 TaxID=1446794 RepID=UPI000D20F0AA|nr:hypothetical protein [Frondihabitans sp. 762G35]ARC56529.1 hypothetical protein AS850_05505 [Frondihabitans sp. 762G35]
MDTGPLQRAETDADFRARLDRAFRGQGGEGDVVEELRRRERPAAAAPAGPPDARDRERALVEAAFGPAASGDSARRAAAELQAVRAARLRQERALDAAIAETSLSVEPAEATPATDESSFEAAAGRRSGDPRPGRALRAAALVAAVALGVGIGAVVFAPSQRVETSPGSATPTVTSASGDGSGGGDRFTKDGASPGVDVEAALARVQVPPDALPDALAEQLAPPTSRLLFDEAPSDAAGTPRWRIWVGQGQNDQQLCLLATRDARAFSRSCAPRAVVLADRLYLSEHSTTETLFALLDGGALRVSIS